MSKTVVVDYGIGNVFSVCNALRAIGSEAKLTRNLSDIRDADRLILPGVGAFGRAIEALKSLGLDEALHRYKETERPFLGICIGMQLAMSVSHEFGTFEGLDLVKGSVERISSTSSEGKPIPVPHIAWTRISAPDDVQSDWAGTPFEVFSGGDPTVYFVHSYHCVPSDPANLLAVAEYGGQTVTAAIRDNSFLGVQFHPERSGPTGLKFLSRFADS